jgi:hypothetical protein
MKPTMVVPAAPSMTFFAAEQSKFRLRMPAMACALRQSSSLRVRAGH